MHQTTWILQRALLAIALLVGFYLFAVGIALVLLAIPLAEWYVAERIHIKIAAVCIGGAGAILWGIVPRPDRFVPPGPRVDPSAYPRLVTIIRDIAARLGQALPSEVFLLNEVNAWVTHRGGVMGIGSQRVMGIGLPLLQTLTVGELRAVLAHEFGHYSSGDVKLGPWIYKTRAAIGRTLQGVRQTFLEEPFLWYGRNFLRLTHGISRQQEYVADRLAATVAGPQALSRALRRITAVSTAFSGYVSNELLPVMRAGFLPPIASGFQEFLDATPVEQASSEIMRAAEAGGDAAEFDTHPSLRERLAALDGLTTEEQTTAEDGERASALVGDLDECARSIAEHALGPEPIRTLRPLSWEQVADQVYVPSWREVVAQHSQWLSQRLVDALPSGSGPYITLGSDLVSRGEINVNSPERVERAVYVLTAGLGVLLLDAGWQARTAPGLPVTLVMGDATLDPGAAIRGLAEGCISKHAWVSRCQELGIAGRHLGGVGEPGGTAPFRPVSA